MIHKHICDKVIPDQDKVVVEQKKGNLAMKLALALGLIPGTGESFADDLLAKISDILTNL